MGDDPGIGTHTGEFHCGGGQEQYVTFRFQRNPDVARNRRLGGQEHIRLIAIDYHAATGTARTRYKGD